MEIVVSKFVLKSESDPFRAEVISSNGDEFEVFGHHAGVTLSQNGELIYSNNQNENENYYDVGYEDSCLTALKLAGYEFLFHDESIVDRSSTLIRFEINRYAAVSLGDPVEYLIENNNGEEFTLKYTRHNMRTNSPAVTLSSEFETLVTYKAPLFKDVPSLEDLVRVFSSRGVLLFYENSILDNGLIEERRHMSQERKRALVNERKAEERKRQSELRKAQKGAVKLKQVTQVITGQVYTANSTKLVPYLFVNKEGSVSVWKDGELEFKKELKESDTVPGEFKDILKLLEKDLVFFDCVQAEYKSEDPVGLPFLF